MCYFVYSLIPVCYDVRLSHLNKDYLLTYLFNYLLTTVRKLFFTYLYSHRRMWAWLRINK